MIIPIEYPSFILSRWFYFTINQHLDLWMVWMVAKFTIPKPFGIGTNGNPTV